MAWSYAIDTGRRLVLTRYFGTVTDRDLFDHVEALVADPDFDSEFDQLVDNRGAVRVEVSGDTIVELVRTSPFSRSARRAVIAHHDLAFGLSRRYELQGQHDPNRFRVFRDADEAVAWLGVDVVLEG